MRRFLAAIAFLSRLPVPVRELEAADIGKATLWFPLVGALIGATLALAGWALAGRLPALLSSVLVVALGALVTGALHLDGLADVADGFGGGRTREDVLRIMRDHAVGAFGVVAVALLLAVKIAALAALLGAENGMTYHSVFVIPSAAERGAGAWTLKNGMTCHSGLGALIVAAALGRWSAVPLGRFLRYARKDGGLGAAVTEHVGPAELLGATLLAAGIAVGLCGVVRGGIYLGAVAALTAAIGVESRRRIGGVTGDVMGAATEIAEALVYVLAVALG